MHEIPISYKIATSLDSIGFWKSGIDIDHDCLFRNRACDLSDCTPEIKVRPCKYIFKVKLNKPKVFLVALGRR